MCQGASTGLDQPLREDSPAIYSRMESLRNGCGSFFCTKEGDGKREENTRKERREHESQEEQTAAESSRREPRERRTARRAGDDPVAQRASARDMGRDRSDGR